MCVIEVCLGGEAPGGSAARVYGDGAPWVALRLGGSFSIGSQGAGGNLAMAGLGSPRWLGWPGPGGKS